MVDRSSQIQEANEAVSCESCGGAFGADFRTVRGHYSSDLFRLMKCKHCGLIYVSPRLNGCFRSFCYREERHLVGWFLRDEPRARSLASKVCDILAMLGYEGGDLLDVGSGIGTFLMVAQDRGFRVTGIELNKCSAEYAARRNTVIHDDFERASLPKESFDIVVMEQTLEHLGKPLGALIKAWHLLRPGGCIYVGVPRVDWMVLLRDRLRRGRDAAGQLWSPEDHLYYFTPRTMHAMLAAAGFQTGTHPRASMRRAIRERLALSPGQFLGRKAIGRQPLTAAEKP